MVHVFTVTEGSDDEVLRRPTGRGRTVSSRHPRGRGDGSLSVKGFRVSKVCERIRKSSCHGGQKPETQSDHSVRIKIFFFFCKEL